MKHYVEVINTVVFQKAWTPIFESLTDEKAGKLIKALFAFMNGKNVELKDETLNAIFLLMANQIERNARKYYSRVCQEDGDE